MPGPLDVVVYDAEIARCIPDRATLLDVLDPTLDYCAGWDDYAGMGIAVVCAVDLRDRRPRVFLEDNLPTFAALIDGRYVCGFNNRGFDDKLLRAHAVPVASERSYDLLRALRVAAGEPADYRKGVTRAGRTLGALADANLALTSRAKPGEGAQAPVLWQRGRRGEVIDYCLHDVLLLAALLRRLPRLRDPVEMQLLTVTLETSLPVPAAE